MSLKKYRKKRDFSRTPEPRGKVIQKPEKIFVINKHQATHLHYDFRLEMGGVLKSWAIPKEPPKVKGVKRLAMKVEDHPIDYAEFSGQIPKGQYGGGRVEIWDKGKYILEKKSSQEIVFELRGRRLKGPYALVKFKGQSSNQWLFFKRK